MPKQRGSVIYSTASRGTQMDQTIINWARFTKKYVISITSRVRFRRRSTTCSRCFRSMYMLFKSIQALSKCSKQWQAYPLIYCLGEFIRPVQVQKFMARLVGIILHTWCILFKRSTSAPLGDRNKCFLFLVWGPRYYRLRWDMQISFNLVNVHDVTPIIC